MSSGSAESRAAPASASATACASTTTPHGVDLEGRRRLTVGWEFVHTRSTTTVGSHTPRYCPTKSGDRDRIPPSRRRLLPPLRDHRRTTAHRQRLRLRVSDPRARLPPARHPPPAHAPLPAAHPARPSASSAPCSPPGPTALSTAQAPNALPPLTAGSGTTTIDADTQQTPMKAMVAPESAPSASETPNINRPAAPPRRAPSDAAMIISAAPTPAAP
jgi:hypothetical protein